MTHIEQPLEFTEYGCSGGDLVVYFHGAPGAIEEACIFEGYAKNHNLRVLCFDRFAIDGEHYYQRLAMQIRWQAQGQPLAVIGFSIGAHVALEVSAILGNQVRYAHLISAVAPINDGDFLHKMAGGTVFKLAMDWPLVFSSLTGFQKLLANLAPRTLVKILFASAVGKDQQLLNQTDFKRYITAILRHCFAGRVAGYTRDIMLYTKWTCELEGFTTPVSLWHGVEDNWSPLSMASYLNVAIPGESSVEEMSGLSHYSCLLEAAPMICERLSTS